MNGSPDFSSPETAARVLEFLRDNPTASVRATGEGVGVGPSTVHRAIARLVADGALRVIRMGTGDGYPSTYEVLDEAGAPKAETDARVDELGRAIVWARSRHAPRPLTADALHRYALDRTAWLRGEAPR